MSKKTLAIVSTLDDLCGIAGYTRALAKQLSDEFEVKIFDLDQYFIRNTNKQVAAQADQMIDDIARDVAKFDCVNIQLEYGTLGRRNKDIIRRFVKLAEAARNLSVTFHTILPQNPFETEHFLANLARFRLSRAGHMLEHYMRNQNLIRSVYGTIERLQKQKNVSVIVHTRRDARLMKYVNGISRVFDHPLSFISQEDAASLREAMTRAQFAQLNNLEDNTKIIGVFGFLGAYKGFETAIRALYHLPDNYHLAFFGGLHPNEVRKGDSIHPYIENLLRVGNVNASELPAQSRKTRNMSKRMHFMGPQTDEGFAQAMAVCDCVVLPYLEVGQSSSGPMSIAVDMGAPIVAARNHAFMQFSRYHPEFGDTFEIGNYLELAEKVVVAVGASVKPSAPVYNTRTNAALYVKAHLVD